MITHHHHAMPPLAPVRRACTGSFQLAALALALAGSAMASESTFPTPDQRQALQAAAAKAHPLPPELCTHLASNLADMIAAAATSPLQMLWLPKGFQLDGDAFRQAFLEDWNRRDDIDERSRSAEEAFAPVRQKLQMLQRQNESNLAKAHAALPGVTVLENGIHIETQAAARAGENVSMLEANSLEVRDLKGNLFFASPFGEGNLIDMADLPEPVAELVDRLPAARAWIFLLPTALLTAETPPPESPSMMLLILQNTADNNRSSAWDTFFGRLAPALANLRCGPCDAAFRTGLSTYTGHMAALHSKHALRALPLDTPIDGRQLSDTLLERLNRAIGIPMTLGEDHPALDAAKATLQTCRDILEARQTEVERGLLRLHARQPGVRTAPSGLQYSVEQAVTAEDNLPFSRANRVRVARIGGKTLIEGSMHPGELDCIAEIAEEIPNGKTWTFYVPANLTGDYRLLDNMAAGVVLTFSADKDAEEGEDWPREEMPDNDETSPPAPEPAGQDTAARKAPAAG